MSADLPDPLNLIITGPRDISNMDIITIMFIVILSLIIYSLSSPLFGPVNGWLFCDFLMYLEVLSSL